METMLVVVRPNTLLTCYGTDELPFHRDPSVKVAPDFCGGLISDTSRL
jgi:hypothetical protein